MQGVSMYISRPELAIDLQGHRGCVQDVIKVMEFLYPYKLKEEWDKVGLILGDPDWPVRKILLAVDPVPIVVKEAIDLEVDMVITHHPLYLRGTSFLATTDYKGKAVTDLLMNRIALANAHTNADSASRGVAYALAAAFGLRETRPLAPSKDDPTLGLGPVGRVPEPVELAQLAREAARVLPVGSSGILMSGDPATRIETFAVSGGAGDSLLEAAARSGAQAYLTADLRHHPSSEHIEDGGCALLCGSHYATEFPWLPIAAKDISGELAKVGLGIQVYVSRTITDPWVEYFPAE